MPLLGLPLPESESESAVHHIHNPHLHNQHQHRPEQHSHNQEQRKSSQTQISGLGRSALLSSMSAKEYALSQPDVTSSPELPPTSDNIDGGMEQLKVVPQREALSVGEKPSSMRRRVTEERVNFAQDTKDGAKPRPIPHGQAQESPAGSPVGSPKQALNDTPATTAPSSPSILPKRQNSVEKVRVRHPTTLDIPGLTKSAVSPDGRIAQRDLGAKLVIVMVGLPARGKSYITKKMARYLNWLQHDTRIFNVGERRRVAASGNTPRPSTLHEKGSSGSNPRDVFRQQYLANGQTNGHHMDAPAVAAHILMNGGSAIESGPSSPDEVKRQDGTHMAKVPELILPDAAHSDDTPEQEHQETLDQSAGFFDPSNKAAAILRQQVALEALDDLLDYVMNGNGAVGILDATNHTVERRKIVMEKIREKAGPDLNVLFLESVCVDENLLERNIRLKLSGPDYKDKDPESSLADFRERIAIYEKTYVPLGDYEEKNKIPYIQMVDVGRKVISHKIDGFLSSQAVYYLLNFNLAPRQIWMTRHGESEDNLSGKLGGDSGLTKAGHEYAKALTIFVDQERKAWEVRELDRHRQSHFPPQAGDITPPNPHVEDEDDIIHKSFCVWTSMLQRSIQTSEYFDAADYDLKQMRMLNEIYAGKYEGYTYEQIKEMDRDTFDERKRDKLHYRYPGPGGEGYLDVINRLRPVIVELERMTDHCLLIGHRSVARILLAYFKGLGRDEVTDLDVPIGMLYCLEPKPYGVDFKAYRYCPDTKDFEYVPGYTLQRADSYVEP